MSINNPYHDKNENQHRDRLDEINNYPPEYKKEYDLLSEEEKQKRWSLLFNSEAYNIAHWPFRFAKFKQKHAHIEGSIERFLPEALIGWVIPTVTLNDIFETTPEEQERIFSFFREYGIKHGKQKDIEDFIHRTIEDNKRYNRPLTQRQKNILWQKIDLKYLKLDEHGKQDWWNDEFLIMMEHDTWVFVLNSRKWEKFFPLSLSEYKDLYEVMETNFDRFIPGILDYLEENGYKKTLEEVFIMPEEELQKLTPMVAFARDMRKTFQKILHQNQE